MSVPEKKKKINSTENVDEVNKTSLPKDTLLNSNKENHAVKSTESESYGFKLLKCQANKFLNAKVKYPRSFVMIVDMAKKIIKTEPSTISEGARFLKNLFVQLLTTEDDLTQEQQEQQVEDTNSLEYALRKQLEDIYIILLSHINTTVESDASIILDAVLSILVAEGSNPGIGKNKGFPYSRFYKILQTLLSTTVQTPPALRLIKQYTKNVDVLHYIWSTLSVLIYSSKYSNFIYAHNVITLIRSSNPIDRSKTNDRLVNCGSNSLYKIETLKSNVDKVWQSIMIKFDEVNAKFGLHKAVLLALNEVFIGFMEKPVCLTDFLMDSMESGGAISLLSLHGIYVLMQKENISFPDVYKKLYNLFEPEIFVSKYKARLIYLADLFLSSTHLPETLVAAFIKRLARLSLSFSPNNIIIVVNFIRVLVQRHPSLQTLVIAKIPKEVENDPYVMDEPEPEESGARSSFLWEIDLLKNNAIPQVAAAACALFALTPLKETEFSQIIGEEDFKVFEVVTNAGMTNIARNNNTPNEFHTPESDKFQSSWDLF